MTEINNPHDKFFKITFSRPEQVEDFCRNYMPSQILEHLDLATLASAKDTFVDSDFQELFSDLIYTVQLKTGETMYLYLLFEHKSDPDRFTLLQLLNYEVNIWLFDRKVQEKYWLPPILPIVIYHGNRKWSAPVEFQELVPAIPGLEPYIPQFRCLLFDLSKMEEDSIKGNFMLRTTLYILKNIQNALLPRKLKKIDEWVVALGKERDQYEKFLKEMLKYLYHGTDKVSLQQIKEELKDILEKRGNTEMPTPADELIEEGRIKGIKEGEQIGELKGVREDILEILDSRFGNPTIQTVDYLSQIEDKTRLRYLLKSAYTVSSIKDFERVLFEEAR